MVRSWSISAFWGDTLGLDLKIAFMKRFSHFEALQPYFKIIQTVVNINDYVRCALSDVAAGMITNHTADMACGSTARQHI